MSDYAKILQTLYAKLDRQQKNVEATKEHIIAIEKLQAADKAPRK